MKTKLILILCILISLNGFAQSNKVEKDDHLYPVQGYFDIFETTATCYSKIRTVLFKGLKERPQVRYFECPSFYEESMFQIENRNNTYEFLLTSMGCFGQFKKLKVSFSPSFLEYSNVVIMPKKVGNA